MVRLLLEKRANILVANSVRLTPLNVALNNRNIELVKLLLKKRANIIVTNNDR